MNRKQLTILLVALAVVGGAGLVLLKRDSASWSAGAAGLGQKLLANLAVNDVTQIDIRQGTNSLTLKKSGEVWAVSERAEYPAGFSEIRDFLVKIADQKVLQSEPIGPSQHPRLELVEPGKGTNSGTLVEFKNKDGKLLDSVILGKKHMRKPAQPSGLGDEGWPDGRYVLVRSNPKNVLLVPEAFSNVEPKPESWLSKDFFKVEKVRSIALTSPTNAAASWKLARETESGEWKLADAKPEEQLDATKTSSLNYALSSPSFNDVVLPSVKPETIGLDKPTVITLETFDDFTYTLKVGGKSGEDSFHLTVAVAAKIPKERAPGKDEKPEDKDKLDKEFKDKTQKLQEKLNQEQAYEKWTYLVAKWTIDSLLKERKDFLAEKKAEEKQADAPKPEAATPPPPPAAPEPK